MSEVFTGSTARQAPTVRGYVPGAWDMFHIGHLNIISRARGLCDHLIVGVVTDDVLVQAKGRRPMVPLDERLAMVESIDLVDEVVIDYGGNKADVWHRIPFDVLFKGDDWKGTAKGERLERNMAEIGVRVQYFPYTMHTSSTALRELIAMRG